MISRGFEPIWADATGFAPRCESCSSIRRQLLLSPHEALASLAAEVVRGPSFRTGDERP